MIPSYKFKGIDTIQYKGFLWIVLIILPDTEGVNVSDIREKYNADIILRRNQQLYVCEIIEEPEIISE